MKNSIKLSILVAGLILGFVLGDAMAQSKKSPELSPSRVEDGIYKVENIFIVDPKEGPTFGFTIMRESGVGGYTLWGPSGLTFKSGMSVNQRVIVTNGTILRYQTPEEKAEDEAYNAQLKKEEEEDKKREAQRK